MNLNLNQSQQNELELLLSGAFYPLSTFMNKKDYENCLYNMRLSTGELFPIPIVFNLLNTICDKLNLNDVLILRDETGIALAEMNVEEIYEPKLTDECIYVLGTIDYTHPYYSNIMSCSNCKYISGKIKKIQLPLHYDFKELRMTPEETKKYFTDNNWDVVVGFQTRNPLHKSHYELTLNAINEISKQTGKNAKLLLHPVVGITQNCDIDYYTRVRCYKKVIEKYKPNTVLLSLLPFNMRMAGPREAMMHCIIRKNYGCTHFIVGRDHAGPSYKTINNENFYGAFDAHKLLLQHEEELGIKIYLSKNIVYVKELDKYLEEQHVPKDMHILNISGTEQRLMLKNNIDIPLWFSWTEIIKELKQEFIIQNKKGLCIYLIGLSGSGKSTIANFLINKLKEIETERKITLFDADVIRLNLSKGLGFSKEDRQTNVKRIGYVASLVVQHGGIAICANIAPFEEDRLFNRKQISEHGKYIEIFVNTSIDCCEKRDTKGLYKLAKTGAIKNFTGVNDPFELPQNSDLIIDGETDIEENLNKILKIVYN
jgi:sulfate adenylyltransferase